MENTLDPDVNFRSGKFGSTRQNARIISLNFPTSMPDGPCASLQSQYRRTRDLCHASAPGLRAVTVLAIVEIILLSTEYAVRVLLTKTKRFVAKRKSRPGYFFAALAAMGQVRPKIDRELEPRVFCQPQTRQHWRRSKRTRLQEIIHVK